MLHFSVDDKELKELIARSPVALRYESGIIVMPLEISDLSRTIKGFWSEGYVTETRSRCDGYISKCIHTIRVNVSFSHSVTLALTTLSNFYTAPPLLNCTLFAPEAKKTGHNQSKSHEMSRYGVDCSSYNDMYNDMSGGGAVTDNLTLVRCRVAILICRISEPLHRARPAGSGAEWRTVYGDAHEYILYTKILRTARSNEAVDIASKLRVRQSVFSVGATRSFQADSCCTKCPAEWRLGCVTKWGIETETWWLYRVAQLVKNRQGGAKNRATI